MSMIPLAIPARYRSARGWIDAALKREARTHGALPAGTRREAMALWGHLTVGSDAVISPMALLLMMSLRYRPIRTSLPMPPGLSRFVVGAVAGNKRREASGRSSARRDHAASAGTGLATST